MNNEQLQRYKTMVIHLQSWPILFINLAESEPITGGKTRAFNGPAKE